MNSKPLPTAVQTVQQFVRSNLVPTMTITIASSLLLTGGSAANIWQVYQGFRHTVERQFEMEKRSSEIKYLDEVLTMSARMAATTGNAKWEKRYNNFVPKLDDAIKYTLDNSNAAIRAQAQQTDQANAQLVKLEADAFALVQKGQLPAAQSLLFGAQYEQQKAIYSTGNNLVLTQVEKLIQGQLQGYQQQLLVSIGFAIGILPILLGSWSLVLSAVRGYIRDQQLAQDALQASQDNLLTVNAALADEAQQRQQQKQFTQQENDQLQQDIGELLDVVSEIESGNLTIQAQVNDRATGLVSDTINRLVEELGKTMRRVAVAAQRVEATGQSQKNITTIVTSNIDRQTQSVGQVLQLTKAVRQSAQSTVQQLVSTNESLVVLQLAVTDGQSIITNLDQDIDVLQVGSDRLVQEIKTLGEFVGLTDQFVQDQGEIVTQTQILALNAALVAARAAEQRDPKQFMTVAREFESIATQVSQLAQQTNDGLTNLEQRSAQIHRVVSSVNIDVQQLGGLVNSFTQGVKHTRAVFSQVQSVTEKTVQSGKIVAIASQKIVGAADATVTDIESITVFAQQISQQSKDAQQLGDQLNILSQDLLENIQVFRLPAVTILPGDSPVIEPVAQPPLIALEFAS
jgi:methyl-accepting chemotaxis protein PixJ